ncbi:MAG: hypothetical protein AABX47_05375 [Nanoarchaeota archaeon]
MNSKEIIIQHLGSILYELAEHDRLRQAKNSDPGEFQQNRIVPSRDLDHALAESIASGDYSGLPAACTARIKGARKSRCPADKDVTTLMAYGMSMEFLKCTSEANRYYNLARRLNPEAYQKLRALLHEPGPRGLL